MGMKYSRQTIDAGVFADMMPDGAKLYRRPEVPMFSFKKDGVKYNVTDFRLLNPLGVRAFEICLNVMLNDPNASECRIECKGDLDDDTIEIVKDIVLGFQYKAEKGGKNGFKLESCGGFAGVTTEIPEEGNKILAFHLGGNFRRYAFEYREHHSGETVKLLDLVVYAVGRDIDELGMAVAHDV